MTPKHKTISSTEWQRGFIPKMPNPTADHYTATADPSDYESLLDDDEEYEEVEEEVEIEEEVEVEDEENEEDEEEAEFGEDFPPVNEDQPEDVAHDIETTGQEEQFNSGSITQEKSLSVLSRDTDAVEVNKGPNMTDQMDKAEEEESRINSVNPKYSELGKVVIASEDHEYQESSAAGKRTPKDHGDAHYNNKAPLNGNVILNVLTSEPYSKSGDELTAAVSVKNDFSVEATGIQYSEEKSKRMCLQSEDIKHRVPRLDVPMARPRSLSPGMEFKDGNKRPAVICDFFAKGWCIKGKSCRFLHVMDATGQQLVEAEADANQKTAQRTNEGPEGCTVKPRLTGFPDGASSAVDTSHSSDTVLSRELGQSSSWKDESQDLNLFKDDSKSIPSFKNVGRESLRENWYSRDHGKYNSEEVAGKKSQFLLDGRSFPLFSHSRNTSSSTSLQNVTGPLPSTRISTLTRSSLSFGSSSWNLDPLGSHKRFDGDREYGASRSASLHQSSSPFSGSESENPYWKNASGDYMHSDGCKAKISFYNWEYNWEPSAPFRPSSSITQRLLSSVNQYDPIRDSIEPPKSRDVVSKFSISSQGMSGPEYNFGKQSLSGQYNNHDNVLDNKDYGKDSISTKAETVATAIAELENRNPFLKEEKILRSANVKYFTKGSTTNTDHDFINQTDRLIQKTKSKIDTDGQTSEMDVDLKIDEDMLRESKALKHFRVTLIDFVKELVKPTWREGNLSKDAHKMIVKRAVDRVLSTVPTHQIPCTPESVKLFLSSSQPKIARLVEGYIDKYGKV